MNIVFIVDNYYPMMDANGLVVKAICDYIVKNGHEVCVLPAHYDSKLPQEEDLNGTHIIRALPSDTKETMVSEIKSLNLFRAFKIFSVLVASKLFGPDTLRNKKGYAATAFLEKWLVQRETDMVVSVNCSVENSFPLLALKRKGKLPCKWIFYMIDPFASHEYYLKHNKKSRLYKLQHRIISACTRVCATKSIYQDTAKLESKNILDKFVITEFPKIQKPDIPVGEREQSFFGEGLNVLCTGTRNEEVRSSVYTLALCQRIKEVTFHFIGHGWSDGEVVRQDNVVFYPPCEHERILAMQEQADFLLNVGNKVTNQLPSKVLEYICMGKPIVNIYKSQKCPTLELLRNWDTLNIFEQTPLDSAEEALREFLQASHSPLAFDEIEKMYPDYTPQHVAANFLV